MKIFKNNHRLTCLAIHPQKGFIATGDYIGVIKIWYFNKETQKPLNSELHWHSHGVNTITFTSDGEYLLSGGNESVLVVWQLQTGAKNFLPRLGSEILWIRVSPDEKYFLLACGDNTVRLVSSLTLATLNITHGPVFSGPAARSSFPLLTVNPRRGYLLLPAMPGYLQFYDIVSDKHVDTLAVSPRNFYLAMQKSTRLSKTVIEHAVFSWDASRLATVERCDNGKLGNELQLKFWTYEVAVSRFVLNTCADSPHEINVTCLVYHPAKHVVVTTGSDKKFKVWAQCTITKDSTATTFKGEEGQTIPNNKDIYYWSCRNVGAYRGQPPTYADFCHDGHVLL
ncbi:WD repeat-containing protein 75-like [Zophobas morio]|uniref:WD repeat-containing protein 75-like n=1 Tax=Zophobas morio TaxID=2755281 RepID=UPI0030831A55